jgi:predicted  nucleic acid-binding Zn-ribbon protein
MKKTKILCFTAALAFAPAALAVYKCVDEKGITRIGETPPDECAKVPMQELSPSGTVRRTIAPSLTPEQVEANRAVEEKKRAESKAAAEQSRKDEALLNTYASDREIDMTRERNIAPIKGRIKIANERIAAVDKRMKQIEDEMEFYKAGKGKSGKAKEMPESLTHDLDRAKKEKISLEKSIVDADKEIATLTAKYETDKQRWIALKQAKK